MLDLVVLADSGLARGDVDLAEVHELVASKRPGSRVLREAMALADPRSESPWESILRVFHEVMDVPVEPQAELRDEDGNFVARGDLRVRGTRRINEYDGGVHRDAEQHRRDLRRDRRLQDENFERRGYTRDDLVNRAQAMMRDLDTLLGRAPDPRRLRAWWRLLNDSTLTPRGRERLRQRWRRHGPPVQWSKIA